jgi:aerobic carbon-monoxide dehydrogenase medium subunit
MKPAPFEYRAAASAADALALLGSAGGAAYAKVCGGGQSLGPMLNLRLAQVDRLVDVSRLDALRGFALHDDGLVIGAAVTHARIEDGELPDATGGLLPFVAAGIAYRAVRNRGTIGGSIAHADPSADWISTMLLVDASMRIAGPGGERRVRAGAFFLGPFTTVLEADELLVAVEVPRASADACWSYRKTCRKPGEFADAIGAVWVDPQRDVIRAVIGAIDALPHVIDGADAVRALRQPATMTRVLDDAGIEDDYEREVHAAVLRRALAEVFSP